jgi:hypothetical protein
MSIHSVVGNPFSNICRKLECKKSMKNWKLVAENQWKIGKGQFPTTPFKFSFDFQHLS